jgi:hypothetical protein
MVKPRALAALELITRSYFVGRTTDRSAGFSPLRILPVYVLRRRRNEREAFLYAFDLLELDGTGLRREPIECER